MWVFGHLGIGSKLASPFSKGLPYKWLLLGTMLPDLIDKPLYYIPHFITGLSGGDLGLISCTRTFGHSGLLLVLLLLLAWFQKSKITAAIGLGMATHLALDLGLDGGAFLHNDQPTVTWMAMTFPYYGQFAIMPFRSLGEHAKTIGQPMLWGSEILGFLLLCWDYYRRRRLTE